MTQIENSNKNIVRNTTFLYIQMGIVLLLSLYTSRVILATLGIEDYGLYNAIGGVVTIFLYLNSAMANSTQRYITFALGEGNQDNVKSVFSSSFVIHLILAAIIVMLAEFVGLWFVNLKMTIPEGRMYAVQWVFHFSVISCALSIITVPFTALIIAHEKMGVFAFISIVDVCLKLLVAFLIQISGIDKLIIYTLLLCCNQVIIMIIYQIYCRVHFYESRRILLKKTPYLTEMMSFAGWSLIGNLSVAGYTQGLNILLFIYFGPVVNAARGVAVQVQGAVKGFVTNFQTAVNPQITKSYAVGDFNRLHNLLFSSSKLSFFLLLMISIPVFLEAEDILGVWLKEVPEHTVQFLRLILIIMLIDPLSNPLGIANNATGRIRKYQIIEGGLLLTILPVSYLLVKKGYAPETVFIVQLCISIIVQSARVLLVKEKLSFTIKEYLSKVIYRVCAVLIVSIILPTILFFILPQHTISSFLIVCTASIFSVLLAVYLIGFNKSEKYVVLTNIKRFCLKIKLMLEFE